MVKFESGGWAAGKAWARLARIGPIGRRSHGPQAVAGGRMHVLQDKVCLVTGSIVIMSSFTTGTTLMVGGGMSV